MPLDQPYSSLSLKELKDRYFDAESGGIKVSRSRLREDSYNNAMKGFNDWGWAEVNRIKGARESTFNAMFPWANGDPSKLKPEHIKRWNAYIQQSAEIFNAQYQAEKKKREKLAENKFNDRWKDIETMKAMSKVPIEIRKRRDEALETFANLYDPKLSSDELIGRINFTANQLFPQIAATGNVKTFLDSTIQMIQEKGADSPEVKQLFSTVQSAIKTRKEPKTDSLKLYDEETGEYVKTIDVKRGEEPIIPKGLTAEKPEKDSDYLKDKAKLVDDTRAFYMDKSRHLLDPDGLIRIGPEGDEDKYINEYNKILNQMSKDMVTIRKGNIPAWLSGDEIEEETGPPEGFVDSGRTSGGKKVYINEATGQAWIE